MKEREKGWKKGEKKRREGWREKKKFTEPAY